jgi:HK97 family phage prohead protease
MTYDFSGYATRNDIECSDGRVIKHNAFKECDRTNVPLVWQHDHMSPENVLGHAMLENRDDGVYAYGVFNDTPAGASAKELVKNGDVKALSIYANKLKQNGNQVLHGAIREVSLVLAGANPGAYIDTVLVHDDDDEEEAIIGFDEPLELSHSCDNKSSNDDSSDDKKKKDIEHSKDDAKAEDTPIEENKKMADTNTNPTPDASSDDKTVQDVIDSMTDEQKNVLYALVGMAAQDGGSDTTNEGDSDMKHNVFEGDDMGNSFAHAEDFAEIIRDGKRYGSLKESALQHDMGDIAMGDVLEHADYGMNNVDYLFPDYKNVDKFPGFVSRNMDWVPSIMGAVSHTPFSRIKTVFADITEDEARAKGYMKGHLKKEEVFTLLKRTTDPQTVYKKQKLDRDDVNDITDFDVVAWLKGEMRTMLDEELGRAFLVGDGRDSSSDDKINPLHIRPIWTDDPFYTIKADLEVKTTMTDDDKYAALIRSAVMARKDYKGSGNPVFYTTEANLTGMLLLTDKMGRDLYESEDQLAKKLRVSSIVTVPVMEGLSRTGGDSEGAVKGKKLSLEGLIVNLTDYNVGADQGGSVNLFDDFDIDYNAMKYLIETRCSGALIKPYSAIALETYPATCLGQNRRFLKWQSFME